MIRLRLHYTKLGKIRFLSHRDIARVWERTIRRVGLPIAYSEGFSPRPRLHFGLALSVAHESEAEYLDIDLREPVELDGLAGRLSEILPTGIDVLAIAEIPRSADSLQGEVDLVTWQFIVPGVRADELSTRVALWLARDEVLVTIIRKTKPQTADVRSVVESLTVGPETADGTTLIAVLATRPRSIRPAELLASFDPPLDEGRVRRLAQTILTDGVGRPPLPDLTSNPDPVLQESA